MYDNRQLKYLSHLLGNMYFKWQWTLYSNLTKDFPEEFLFNIYKCPQCTGVCSSSEQMCLSSVLNSGMGGTSMNDYLHILFYFFSSS